MPPESASPKGPGESPRKKLRSVNKTAKEPHAKPKEPNAPHASARRPRYRSPVSLVVPMIALLLCTLTFAARPAASVRRLRASPELAASPPWSRSAGRAASLARRFPRGSRPLLSSRKQERPANPGRICSSWDPNRRLAAVQGPGVLTSFGRASVPLDWHPAGASEGPSPPSLRAEVERSGGTGTRSGASRPVRPAGAVPRGYRRGGAVLGRAAGLAPRGLNLIGILTAYGWNDDGGKMRPESASLGSKTA